MAYLNRNFKLTGTVLPNGSRGWLHLETVLAVELTELTRLLSCGSKVELSS